MGWIAGLSLTFLLALAASPSTAQDQANDEADAAVEAAEPGTPPIALTLAPAPARADFLNATPDTRLQRTIAKGVLPGQTAAVLLDLTTGEVLESHLPELGQPPASVLKLVTALYALENLNPDYQFRTAVLGTGPLVGGVLRGDLVLLGGGDPTLDTDELAELADAVASRGVRWITGDLVYDDTSLPHRRALEQGQPLHVAYNPGVAGLNLNFNRVFLEWAAGGEPISLKARAAQNAPPVSAIAAEVVEQGGPVFSYLPGERWQVERSALMKKGGRWLPVRHPGPYAASVFRDLLLARRVTVPRAVPGVATRGRVLAEIRQRPLKRLARGMLHFSTNVTAEAMGLITSGARNPKLSAAAMADWAMGRYGVEGLSFGDHSGLSDRTRLNPVAMVRILEQARRDGTLDGIVRRYGLGGENIEIRAKTGTLNFVRGLAGYIEIPGRPLAFAILSADLEQREAADNTRESPRGAVLFGRRAVTLERRILRDWIARYRS